MPCCYMNQRMLVEFSIKMLQHLVCCCSVRMIEIELMHGVYVGSSWCAC
uniref:Uncharacterized protein n=1 Tax=Arundo donax TaxID=35708 RepID=A0A0A8YIJ6_ARUDO